MKTMYSETWILHSLNQCWPWLYAHFYWSCQNFHNSTVIYVCVFLPNSLNYMFKYSKILPVAVILSNFVSKFKGKFFCNCNFLSLLISLNTFMTMASRSHRQAYILTKYFCCKFYTFIMLVLLFVWLHNELTNSFILFFWLRYINLSKMKLINIIIYFNLYHTGI
jgi:hypothetical protein